MTTFTQRFQERTDLINAESFAKLYVDGLEIQIDSTSDTSMMFKVANGALSEEYVINAIENATENLHWKVSSFSFKRQLSENWSGIIRLIWTENAQIEEKRENL